MAPSLAAFTFALAFMSSAARAQSPIIEWTKEIETSCAVKPPQSAEDEVACQWPEVFREFQSASGELSTAPATLPLAIASGLYEFDAFESRTTTIDARVARWLFAIRFVRQTWPFAQLRLQNKDFFKLALATASLSSADGWTTLWSAYKNLDCRADIHCRLAKAKLLVTLNEASLAIETNTSLKLMINRATDDGATDLILAGDSRKTRDALEKIIGSFTGSNPSFYVNAAGDSSLLLAKEKLAEWEAWLKNRSFAGDVIPLEPKATACENLEAKLNAGFHCLEGRFGGLDIRNARALNALGSDLSFSLLHVRENLAAVLAPMHFDRAQVSFINLLHEVSSYQKVHANLQSLSAQEDLRLIGSRIPADAALVSSLKNEFESAYDHARQEGAQ